MIELAVPTGKRRYLIRIIRKLSHVVWKCKHHLVWCPKYRIRNLNSEVGRSVQDIIKQLCVCVEGCKVFFSDPWCCLFYRRVRFLRQWVSWSLINKVGVPRTDGIIWRNTKHGGRPSGIVFQEKVSNRSKLLW